MLKSLNMEGAGANESLFCAVAAFKIHRENSYISSLMIRRLLNDGAAAGKRGRGDRAVEYLETAANDLNAWVRQHSSREEYEELQARFGTYPPPL